jgi:predicted N-acetyltransferase YhbS
MTISIRPLADTDFLEADAILRLAFQSSASRQQELKLYRQIQPDGWFAATQAGHLIGMVGATNYGAFAHVGMMAVHPEAQGQGVGTALMQFLLAGLGKKHVPLVMLDASKAGRPLYEKLGFAACDETLVFQRLRSITRLDRPAAIQTISARELDELVEWDGDVFGANRRKVFQVLLEAFPGRAFMQRDEHGKVLGYLFAQKNRIGPWVMLQPGQAEGLVLAALALPFDEPVTANVPSGNLEAIELLQRCGFEQVRSNLHMGRGVGGSPGQRQKVFSQTSLAVG